jgi:hypothetical protein
MAESNAEIQTFFESPGVKGVVEAIISGRWK